MFARIDITFTKVVNKRCVVTVIMPPDEKRGDARIVELHDLSALNIDLPN